MTKAWILASLLSVTAQAQQTWVPTVSYDFGGINQFQDSSVISDRDAQDAENVLTDSTYLEKRTGNVRIATILNGFAVAYLNQFIATSGTKYLIAQSSAGIYRTDLSATPALISTFSTTYPLDSAVAYGKIVIVDGVAPNVTWDGASSSTIAGMPICKLVEFGDEALWCANIPSASGSRVAKSRLGTLTDWTVPSNVNLIDDAPNTFDFQRDDGEENTCFKVTPWGKVVGKRHSMHILKGNGNTTYYKRIIDPVIGCVDDRSMQMVDGLLVWLAIDGIYAWGGNGAPVLISKDIEPLVRQIRQLNAVTGTWVVNSQSEWQLGTMSNNGPRNSWDALTTPGSIILTSSTFTDASTTTWAQGTLGSLLISSTTGIQFSTITTRIYNGDFETGDLTYWNCVIHGAGVCGVTASSPLEGSYSGQLLASCGSSGAGAQIRVLNINNVTLSTVAVYSSSPAILSPGITIDLSQWATQQIKLEFEADGGTGISKIETLRSTTFTAISSVSFSASAGGNCPGSNFGWDKLDVVKVNRFFALEQSSAGQVSYTSRIFDNNITTPVAGPFVVNLSTPPGTALAFSVRSSTSPNNDFWNAWQTATSSAWPSNLYSRYWQVGSTFTTQVGTASPVFLGTQIVAISTGNYYSEVHFIGTAITAWKTGDFTDTASPIALAYYVRSATYSFSASATVPAWTAHTNHTNLTVSTGSYVQFRVDSTALHRGTHTATVERGAISWREGIEAPVASGFKDHRYFLCVTLSSTSVVNDTCLVYQRNNKWVKWTGPNVAAMTYYDNNLVAGSANTDSYAWKIMQADVYSDDGEAINAYWITKDFSLGAPFNEKVLKEIWLDLAFSSGSAVSVGYGVNKSTSFASKTVALDAVSNYVNKRVPLDAGYVTGKYLKFKFANSNSIVSDYFRLNGFQFYSDVKARTQD